MQLNWAPNGVTRFLEGCCIHITPGCPTWFVTCENQQSLASILPNVTALMTAAEHPPTRVEFSTAWGPIFHVIGPAE